MPNPASYLLVVAAAAAPGCAPGAGAEADGSAAGAAAAISPANAAERCSVSVRFGSYAMGIDAAAAAAVERIVADDDAVTGIQRSPAGREGEYELCVATQGVEAASKLFERLKSVLPAEPRGPISLRAGERAFAVPRR